jgi:hypothetical protein
MSRSRTKMPLKLVRQRLDAAEVMAHFAALARVAEAIEVRVKHGETHYSEVARADLEQVARRLCAGDVLAAQVRFFQEDAWWCDTVMSRGDSYRLVRMKQS